MNVQTRQPTDATVQREALTRKHTPGTEMWPCGLLGLDRLVGSAREGALRVAPAAAADAFDLGLVGAVELAAEAGRLAVDRRRYLLALVPPGE